MKKVFHIESGLGNQMLDYTDLLIERTNNPKDDYYIDTTVYSINQDRICMWNGYELERIFGIKEHNVLNLFTIQEQEEIIKQIIRTDFWNKKQWDCAQTVCSILNSFGMKISCTIPPSQETYTKIEEYRLGYWLRRNLILLTGRRKKEYYKTEELPENIDLICGHTFAFSLQMYAKQMEKYDALIKSVFKFPQYDNPQDIAFSKLLQETNSVSIHARRGDMLGNIKQYYKFGFFKRATLYIKKHVYNPVFVFFCDPGSIQWCKNNISVFGLDIENDNIHFVDWHTAEDSYRDMQLMSDCKHNIFTSSSFGWWGAFLNPNVDKISITALAGLRATNYL